ncbi:MAG TPA: hypothetical protein VF062_08560 [Candidatus Limnocylindrales bacterium]
MPPSTMIRAMTTALAVSAAAGAAQLGIGYGLGIFSWLPTVRGVDEAAWLASLAWTVWISATSVVVGTIAGDRVARPTVAMSPVSRALWLSRALWRSVLALAAAMGGLVVVALTALPARVAQPADTSAPHLIVGGYAIAGVLLGLLVSLAAVNARPIAANVLVTAAWLWLLAVVARVDNLAAHGEVKVAQLGVWQFTGGGPWFHSIYLPGAALAAGSALLIGAFAAWPAAHHGSGPATVALSGAAGPAMVSLAYLMAAPVLTDVKPEQLSAHLVAPYAVLAGLAGSVLVALLTRATRARSSSPAGRTDHDKTAEVSPAKAQVAGDPV